MSKAVQRIRRDADAALAEMGKRFTAALETREGVDGAHCIQELWMRHEPPLNVEQMLGPLWRAAPESMPEWLQMRHVEWLPLVYEVAVRHERAGRGARTSTSCCSTTRIVRAGRMACMSARASDRRLVPRRSD